MVFLLVCATVLIAMPGIAVIRAVVFVKPAGLVEFMAFAGNAGQGNQKDGGEEKFHPGDLCPRPA